MQRSAPSFPAFDDWKRMSEREQDALLDRLEAQKRRGVVATWLVVGLGLVTAALATGLVLLTLG